MNGDLPPSSNDTGVRWEAASPYTVRAVAGEPVNATRSTSGCPVSGAPAEAPVPCTMLSTPGRHAGLVGEVAEQRAGQRRPLRRLEDDRVAGRQRRTDPPGGEHERRVPRRRHRHHAARVITDPVALAAVQHARRLVEPLDREVGEEADVVGGARQHPQVHRLVQRSVVDALDLRQIRDRGVDRVGEPGQDLVASTGAERRPLGECTPCRRDRTVDLGLGAGGDLGKLPAVPLDRAADLEALAPRRPENRRCSGRSGR